MKDFNKNDNSWKENLIKIIKMITKGPGMEEIWACWDRNAKSHI